MMKKAFYRYKTFVINMNQCRICGNLKENASYIVREMMFGFKDEFAYFECGKCGCLQIAEIPKDLAKYYPSNYYSFGSSSQTTQATGIRRFLRRRRFEVGLLGKGGVIGRLLYGIYPAEFLRVYSLWRISLNRKSRILDVGCGNGRLLFSLREIGFENLLGIDAYIDSDIKYGNGTEIRKTRIQSVPGKWDIVMFQHSLEHIPDQFETLKTVAELLTEKGVCLINMPTVSSYAWNHYRENWVQLDAPRHVCIHSVKSLRMLAEKVNLNVREIFSNSSEFQFLGSEQYIKNIPLCSEYSYMEKEANSIFSRKEIESYKKKTKELNLINRGDEATLILSKS
jgi:ubiquinone/menaquinone biosynthesis C-methylase UbiE